MRVLPPRTLAFRSHWLPTTMIALLLAAGGLGLLMMPRSAGEMAVGSLLMTLSVAVLADRRSLSIDGSERRVPLRCTTDTDARIVAGEIAELMRVRFCAEPKDPAV